MYLGLRIAELKTQLQLNELARTGHKGERKRGAPGHEEEGPARGSGRTGSTRWQRSWPVTSQPQPARTLHRRYQIRDMEDLGNRFSLGGSKIGPRRIGAQRGIDRTRSSPQPRRPIHRRIYLWTRGSLVQESLLSTYPTNRLLREAVGFRGV